MKNLYHRKGGKVHPSSASASASTSTSTTANSCRGDAYTVLRLLPVAIATLKAALPPDDQEVLAYLIARSPDVLPLQETETKKNRYGTKNGKPLLDSMGIDSEQYDQETPPPGGGGGSTGTASSSTPKPFRSSSSPFTRFAEADALLRRSPSGRGGGSMQKEDLKNKRKTTQHILRSHRLSFDCSCFQCYMGFWSRWDASPNREIIHQAIDLYEDHMATTAAAEAVEPSTAKGGASRGKNRKGSKSGKEEKNGDSSKVVNSTSWGGPDERTGVQQQQNAKLESATQDLDAADKEAKSERNILVWGEHEDAPKSKQIVPLAFEEGDGEVRQEEQQQKQEARVGACPLGGRSLMRRMFPNIMGFVADHLWTAWSSPVRATNA